jgi:hypothetical protein
MNPRHAASLALVGWYLMVPPMGSEIDPTCGRSWRPAMTDVFAAIAMWRSVTQLQTARCDHEELEVKNDAPLSEWEQKEPPFETLRACEAYKNAPLSPEENSAIDWSAEHLAARGNVPQKFAKQSFELSVHLARCVPSDDPRLKGK